MTWFKLDDNWLSHHKHRAAGLKGRALWVAAGTYCAQHLTDGRIDKTMLPMLSALSEVGNGRKEAERLVEVGLWHDMGDHWLMHDWDRYQPSREKVESERAKAAERQRKARESRGKSRRDNAVSHASPDPTRPDPTAILTVVPTTTTNHLSPEAVVVDAIEAIAEYELTVAQGSGVSIHRTPDAYRRGIVRRLGTEAGPTLTAWLAAVPTLTAEQLRDRWLEPEPLTSYDELVGRA